jgi:hypothetical protein
MCDCTPGSTLAPRSASGRRCHDGHHATEASLRRFATLPNCDGPRARWGALPAIFLAARTARVSLVNISGRSQHFVLFSGRQVMRAFWIFFVFVATVALGSFTWYYWPLRIHVPSPKIDQVVFASENGIRVFIPNRALLGEIAHFDDGFFAFLMFDYLRARPQLEGTPVLMTSQEQNGPTHYVIQVRLPNDLITGIDFLAELKAAGLSSNVQFRWLLSAQLKSAFDETSVFMKAYDGPAGGRLKRYDAPAIQAYLRRFIRFKSMVDPRISGHLGPIPSPLTRKDASRLAADIIAVAHFYDLPIDLFLGVGAMENNYMNVAGDLKNTIWKRRAESGDIVVHRRRGRVLVRNDSVGVWQITRESLRYAHRLFLKDKRDYSLLPERLRPPKKLDMNSVGPDVLTTYAGLLLRNLLDRFGGDVTLAAGAYNGGPANPNMHYAEGVEMVADYARRVIGRAAEMDRVALEHESVDRTKIHEQPENVASTTAPESETTRSPINLETVHKNAETDAATSVR